MGAEGMKGRFRTDGGAAMVEYALVVALIAVVVAASATLLGTGVGNTLIGAANQVSSQSGQEPGGGNPGGGNPGGGNPGGSNGAGHGGGHGQGAGGGRGH